MIGLELDLVERVQVGRIGQADEQPVAALEQRQRLVLQDEFFADDFDRRLGKVQRFGIEQRNAELGRGGHGYLRAVGQRMLDQVRPERNFLLERRLHGLARVGIGQRPLHHETTRHA